METSARKRAGVICEAGFRIDFQPDQLTVSRDGSAWNPRMRVARYWQMFAAIGVGIGLLALLASDKPLSRPVPLVSLPILLAILLFFVWPLGVNNIRCSREHLEVIRLRRGNETGRWHFPRELVERVHIEPVFGRPEMGYAIAFTVNGNTVRTLRGIQLNEAQAVLLALSELGFDVGVCTSEPGGEAPERRGELAD